VGTWILGCFLFSLFHDDAEGRMIQVDGGSTATYVYDAFGQRVKKTVASCPTEYMYTLDGQIDSMMEGSAGHLTRGFVYLNGRPLVEYANGTTYFVHTDHLGSTRLLTNYPTPTIAESDDYYPFGEFNSSGSTSALKFTTDERDTETTLDHTLFRQYSSSLARWTSPDPAGFLAADASNPQSWNGYTYVQNNPLAFTDPFGLCEHELFDNASCWHNGDGGFAGVGPSTTCFVDGFATDCGSALRILSSGLGNLCANSTCTGGPINGTILLPGGGAVVSSGACVSATLGGQSVGDANCISTSVSVIGVPGTGNSSSAWTFTRTFVSNFVSPHFYKQELAEGGCLAEFGKGVESADVLGFIPPGQPIVEDAIKGTAATVAANYAATQVLTVPLRSSVVRGILAGGETTAAYLAPAYLLATTVSGAIAEGKAIKNGTCH
jgi:RHS repeat-associated protein